MDKNSLKCRGKNGNLTSRIQTGQSVSAKEDLAKQLEAPDELLNGPGTGTVGQHAAEYRRYFLTFQAVIGSHSFLTITEQTLEI